jgi:TPR repeat protein
MKSSILLGLLTTCCIAQAECTSSLPLKGVVTVESCKPSSANCVRADQALNEYISAQRDDGPTVLSIGLHGGPWRVYDAHFRIIEIEELAAEVRRNPKIKRVVLYSSWSGVAPSPGTKSIAQRLSTALNGMPVNGEDGFIWFAKGGAMSTTQQLATAYVSGSYWVPKGKKVMASLVAGWPLALEARFVETKDGPGLLRAAIRHDIFMLCPDRALSAFEAAAALSEPVAAYNAALMRLERGAFGDRESAVALLKRSAALGDKKSQQKLDTLLGQTKL